MTLDAEAIPDTSTEAITVVRTNPENFSRSAWRLGRFLSLRFTRVSWDTGLTPDRKAVVDFRIDIHIVVIPLGRIEAPTPVEASELGTVGFGFLVGPPSL